MPADKQPRFRPDMSQSDLVASYEKIGSRKPFTREDVTKAYEPYGLKIDPSRKKASDTQLRTIAAQAVVKFHKGQKAAAKKPQASTVPSGSPTPARTATSAARPTTPKVRTARQFFDDDYVARAMRTIGLAGVAPSAVPQEFRRSYDELVAYLNQVKAQRALAVIGRTGGGIKLMR